MAGRTGVAQTPKRDGGVNRVAELSDSFLNRNPVNRDLLAADRASAAR